MKELSVEEKAKRYYEALDRAKAAYKDEDRHLKATLERIFPELKESEDEKMRKGIIRNLEYLMDRAEGFVKDELKERIAWLEKQCEQKSIDNLTQQEAMDIAVAKCFDEQNLTDKVEPKFHKGDWVIDKQGIVHQIANVVENVTLHTYGYDIVGGGYFNDNTEGVRLWTIQDAKDGDILSDGTTVFIFKDLLSDGSVMSYCDYDADSGESDAFCPLPVNLVCSKITPVAEKQRDALMKAMTDAGYTFDFEKKELKKIEQKPAWSENDKKFMNEIEESLLAYKIIVMDNDRELANYIEKEINWLKSLKDRVQLQPKQEWSEEVEAAISLLKDIAEEQERR